MRALVLLVILLLVAPVALATADGTETRRYVASNAAVGACADGCDLDGDLGVLGPTSIGVARFPWDASSRFAVLAAEDLLGGPPPLKACASSDGETCDPDDLLTDWTCGPTLVTPFGSPTYVILWVRTLHVDADLDVCVGTTGTITWSSG